MAKVSCSACEDLRQNAPSLIVNGLGTTECTRLKNNTGVSGNSTDCADLEDMNDCFVGNMEAEVDAYDICDWKDFMKKFIPNVWTVLKGVICAICGLWTHLNDLADMLENICKLQEATLQHPVYQYGTNPNAGTERRGGTLNIKGGSTILAARPHSELSDTIWQAQNVGIRYGKLNVESCLTGNCVRHEWIAPDILGYKFNQAPAYDDILWYCSESVAKNTFGITDAQWNAKVANPVGWLSDFTAGNAIFGVAIGVWNGRFEMRMRGVIGASYSDLDGRIINPPADQAERLYRFSCSSN